VGNFIKSRIEYYTLPQSTLRRIFIHTIGLSEVARIKSGKIIEHLEFQEIFSEFLTFLRTDPQFIPKQVMNYLCKLGILQSG
jgi:uncharacterized protein (DUF885 family)